MVGFQHYLVLSGVIFCIGLYGALTKRNVITVLMSIELMFNAVIIAVVAASRYVLPLLLRADDPSTFSSALTGQVFAAFIIVVAAAEVGLGLAIVIALYTSRETVDVTQANLMKH